MKSFLIIGMGEFGHHLCKHLLKHDCEIMAVDQNQEAVEDMLPYVDQAQIGDCTNPEVLKSLGINNFDTCFVCMAGNFQNGLEITSLLKEMGAKKVVSTAETDSQEKFLLRNGSDSVIYPQRDLAEKVAISESFDTVDNCFELAPNYYVFEIKPIEKWLGRSIVETDFRTKYGLLVLAIKKDNQIRPLPPADYVFNADEHLIVFGHIDSMKKIPKK